MFQRYTHVSQLLFFFTMLETLASIKVPKSLTSALQLIQLYTQSGHFYWTSGVVERSKLAKLIQKFVAFRIDRDVPGRAYDKTKKIASVHFVLLDSPNDLLQWVLVSTPGKGGLNDPEATNVGKVSDTRLANQHLQWGNYELLHIEKNVTITRDIKTKKGEILKDRKSTIRSTTWTWRLTRERFLAHEALIVSYAKHKNSRELETEIAALSMMPMFSGVRGQVLKLHGEARKVCLKFKCPVPELPQLPMMVKQPIYSDPATTLLDVCEKT